jgi:hypothetical protein
MLRGDEICIKAGALVTIEVTPNGAEQNSGKTGFPGQAHFAMCSGMLPENRRGEAEIRLANA